MRNPSINLDFPRLYCTLCIAYCNLPLHFTNIPTFSKKCRNFSFVEGQKKATTEVWNEKERKATDSLSELRKTIKDLSTKLVCHINAGDGKHSANESAETIRTVCYPYGADSAQKAHEIYDLQVINRTKEYDRLEAQFTQRKTTYEQLLLRQSELEIYQKIASEGKPAEHTRSGRSAKSKQPAIDEDGSRMVVCRLENEIIRINEQWQQAETIGRKYKDVKGALLGDATKFEQSLLEIEDALAQQNADIDDIEVSDFDLFHLDLSFFGIFFSFLRFSCKILKK